MSASARANFGKHLIGMLFGLVILAMVFADLRWRDQIGKSTDIDFVQGTTIALGIVITVGFGVCMIRSLKQPRTTEPVESTD